MLSLRFRAFEGSGRWLRGPSDGRPAERVRRIADGAAGNREPEAPELEEGVYPAQGFLPLGRDPALAASSLLSSSFWLRKASAEYPAATFV